jgi:hypothetical protein
MYSTLLIIHNLLRWVFLAAAIYAILRSVLGLMNKNVYNKNDNMLTLKKQLSTTFLSMRWI